jgi:hypothetical protein
MVPREDIQKDAKKGDTSQADEEGAQVMMSGVQPSQKKEPQRRWRRRKKMKYTKEGPVITLTEDDVEFVADKVQDRGEDVVHAAEAQREEIMAKLIEFHETLQ